MLHIYMQKNGFNLKNRHGLFVYFLRYIETIFLIRHVKTILKFELVIDIDFLIVFIVIACLEIPLFVMFFVMFNFKHIKMNWHDINLRNDLF